MKNEPMESIDILRTEFTSVGGNTETGMYVFGMESDFKYVQNAASKEYGIEIELTKRSLLPDDNYHYYFKIVTKKFIYEPGQPITIYTTGEFMGSVNKYEGKLIECGVTKYAQYDRAPFVTFIPKGKRKARRILKSYNPYLIVLKGTGHPEPADMFGAPVDAGTGATIRHARYLSFDDRYRTDFDAIINPVIEMNPEIVLMNVRA